MLKLPKYVAGLFAAAVFFFVSCAVMKQDSAPVLKTTSGPCRLSRTSPESMGMNGRILKRCDSVILAAVASHQTPGAVLCIVKDDKIVYERAYGHRSVVPDTTALGTDAIYDLASLTKCFCTTLAAMQLVEQGKLRINAPVEKYLPGFYSDPRYGRRITVKHLMTHTSGLASYVKVDSLVSVWGKCHPDSLRDYIFRDLPRYSKPGVKFRYSCPSFVSVQYLVEAITGERLCDYAQRNIFEPMGLEHTLYLPAGESVPDELLPLIVPTEMQCDGEVLLGRVHDPLARRLNAGNSGNAGLYSCAGDLAVLCAAIMNGGEVAGRRLLKSKTVKQMCKVDRKSGRSTGWDSCSAYSRFASGFGDDNVICHSGYTGTSVVMDLDKRVAVILLANAVHPFDEGNMGATRRAVTDIVAASL